MAKIVYMRTASGFVFTTSHPEFHSMDKRLTIKEGKAMYLQQSKDDLLTLIKPGSVINTLVRSVSSNGMSRRISLYIVDGQEIRSIDNWVSIITGYKHSDKGGLIVGGCGMDMGFHLVYSLGAALWPNGTDTAHGTRNGVPDTDGGYALKHRSL